MFTDEELTQRLNDIDEINDDEELREELNTLLLYTDISKIPPLVFLSASPSKMKILMEYGMDINTIDEYKENALFCCNLKWSTTLTESREEIDEKFNFLINNGINIHQINDKGENALYKEIGSVDNFKKLITMGVDVSKKTISGGNVLFSVDLFKIDLFLKLEECFKYGLSLNDCDNQGETPLFYVPGYYEKMLNFFIANGADINHLNNNNENILMKTDDWKTMLFFIEKGINVHQVNKDGMNALDNCCYYGNVVEKLLDKDIEILQEDSFYEKYRSYNMIMNKKRERLVKKEKKHISDLLTLNSIKPADKKRI